MLDKRIEEEIINVVEGLGYEFYDLVVSRDKIVVYIDKEGGVTVGDCEVVSREISLLLDVDEPFDHSYVLEVSSPGINRELKRIGHFEKAVGKRCAVNTYEEVGGRRTFNGVLAKVKGSSVFIEDKRGTVEIDIGNIKKARVNEI